MTEDNPIQTISNLIGATIGYIIAGAICAIITEIETRNPEGRQIINLRYGQMYKLEKKHNHQKIIIRKPRVSFIPTQQYKRFPVIGNFRG